MINTQNTQNTQTKEQTNCRTMNLTSKENLELFDIPQEMPMLNVVSGFIRKLLTNLTCSDDLRSLRSTIETLINAEDMNTTDRTINKGNVALIIDSNDCEEKSIIALNTHYHTFDINHTTSLSYFSEMKKYGEGLGFPQYDFYQLALKCMCTVKTRIGLRHSCPSFMSEWDYKEQDFLALITQIKNDMAFTLEIDGNPHYVNCTPEGKITVDEDEICTITDLSEKMCTILIAMYHRQPRTPG